VDCCLTLFAATNFWSDPGSYLAILKVVFGLGAVIFVHELFGQTIIPAKLISFNWGETEYGIGAIPLGGYVKMLGQDDNPGHSEEQIKDSIAEGETVESAVLASGMIDQSKLDPRSFLAKSVIQRMLIISAGVIFNLVFAILFAASAFRMGVDYQPPVLGSVKGGGPAWKHDLAGAEITKINGKDVEGYFTYMHFAENVILNSDDSAIPIEFKRSGSDEIVSIDVTPEKGFLRGNPEFALVGVNPALIPVIGSEGAIEGSPAAAAVPAFEAGDKIVDINGTPIETEVDLRQALFRDANKATEFTLERTVGKGDDAKTETIKTTVGVTPEKVVGFSTTWGPIAAIKFESPATKAGLQEGDLVKQIDGKAPGDLLTLDNRICSLIQNTKTITLQVERNGKLLDISIEPELPKLASTLGPNKPIAIDSLGIAIQPTLSIGNVESDSPADQAGMQSGDELVSIKYLLDEKQKADDLLDSLVEKPLIDFVEDDSSWAEVYENVQSLKAGTKFEFVVKRGGETKTLEMAAVESDEFFRHTRGIHLTSLEHHYQSDNWSDAFAAGATKMTDDLKRVGKTLKTLVQGKISPTNLGGPGTIAVVATSEAAASTSRLLLFLTFLSANLAIVNFLPIPVLDGGHMMFLAYEGIFRRPVNDSWPF